MANIDKYSHLLQESSNSRFGITRNSTVHGENGIKEQQPVRRPDIDRDPVRQRLYFATFVGSGGVSETRPRRHRGRQGPDRNDSGEVPQGCRLPLRVQGSALVFLDLRRNRSPGSWRTCGRLRQRRCSVVRGSDSPPPPESRAVGYGTGMFALAAVRRRSRPQPSRFAVGSRKNLACRLRPASPARRSSRKPRRQPGRGLRMGADLEL